ncbi:OLC1v1011057C1 [Oldenlandia corymbosa var. corymbosa]|uniref:OLC1v1011057C1 n=1 Tax=Oldenlandia corymbosa var. corymbosa TaxID=529605 RepID=A0AAV1DV58_OLDCO|nr:OLC1v1011057C1 [Oldenlandia corymbosa var. corymbosa]
MVFLAFLSSPSPAIKWLGFVCAVWVQAVAGNNYTFSNYSDALKSLMALSQLQLNNLSVAKDVGKAFGILAGLASNKLPPSTILILGAIQGLIGYGAQWLVVSQKIAPLPYWQMCVFLCLGGNSTTWMNTAVLVTCMRNFKNNQGPISGILKGYLGLSTAIFTDASTALFSANPSAFLLTLTIIPGIICLIAAIFLREMPPTAAQEKNQSSMLNFFNVMAIIVALYLLAYDISGNHGRIVSLVFAAGLFVLLAAPLCIPLYFVFSTQTTNVDVERQENQSLLIQDNKNSAIKVEDGIEVKPQPVIGEDHTIFQASCTFEFWVLFLSFLCGVGTGMCVLNNLGQMGRALGYSDVSIFISLTSIWGFFGRIISGIASEYYIGKSATPRPLWNALSQVLVAAGFVVMAFPFPGSLHMGSSMVGMCYGVRLAVTVPIASELFGLKYFGLMYNILILNLPLGSFLFSGLLAGYLYDAQATTAIDGVGNTCIGPHCYRLVFIIMAVVSILGFGLDLLLAQRTKNLYMKIYEIKKLKKYIARNTSLK